MTFLFLLLSYFSVVFLRRLDPVFDEVAEEEEGGEGFEELEDFEDQGKQPFDHVYETPFYACHIALHYCCIGIMMRW